LALRAFVARPCTRARRRGRRPTACCRDRGDVLRGGNWRHPRGPPSESGRTRTRRARSRRARCPGRRRRRGVERDSGGCRGRGPGTMWRSLDGRITPWALNANPPMRYGERPVMKRPKQRLRVERVGHRLRAGSNASANRFANSVCATAFSRLFVTPRAASRRTRARSAASSRLTSSMVHPPRSGLLAII